MEPKKVTREKTADAIDEQLERDWADVRQWIDELQNDWAERRRMTETQQQTEINRDEDN